MHWLLQGIISGVVSTFIATSLLFLIKEKWGNNLIMSGNHNQKLHISKLNPFGISVFITALFTALSGFSFYYQWVNMPYIITITIFFWFGSGLIYQYQCPKCNKIFIRITHQPDVLKEEKRPFRHRDCTITTYTDGSIKDRKYHGKEKVRMETWRLQKNNYSCRSCKHEWKSNAYWNNIDKANRPKAHVKSSGVRNPEEPKIC